MKGGKRAGSGRPIGTTGPETKPRAVRLTEPHHAMFVQLGGIRWLRRLLDEAIRKLG